MSSSHESELLESFLGQLVVLDLASPYVCLGQLIRSDETFLELVDADLHDLRDSQTTRDIYVYQSATVGIRRNRTHVLIRRDEVIAASKLESVRES